VVQPLAVAIGVAHAIEAGLRHNPHRRVELRTAEGVAFERLGDLPRALEAYRGSVPRGPLRSANASLARIAQLKQKLASAPEPD
jgi:hypothetical protein